jgi:hypothetical protein
MRWSKPALTLVGTLGILAPTRAWADDKADCIAAFEAAQALRGDGKLTLAIPKFAVCARNVCPHSMQALCVEQSREASSLLPTVVLSATDPNGADVVEAKVSVDGTVVATVLDGKAIPIDPGLHTFRFEKEGAEAVEHRVAIREGQKGQAVTVRFTSTAPAVPPPPVVVAPIAPPPPIVAPPAVVAPPAPSAVASPVLEARTPAVRHPLRTVGFISLGAAAVGLGVGAVTGAMALSDGSMVSSNCPHGVCKVNEGSTLSAGQALGNASTASFIAAGVFAAFGTFAVVYRGSSEPAATSSVWRLWMGPRSAGVGGTF